MKIMCSYTELNFRPMSMMQRVSHQERAPNAWPGDEMYLYKQFKLARV